MDYHSTLHESENYRLATLERHYLVQDALWKCKSVEDKTMRFQKFLSDNKRKTKAPYIKSSDGTYSI